MRTGNKRITSTGVSVRWWIASLLCLIITGSSSVAPSRGEAPATRPTGEPAAGSDAPFGRRMGGSMGPGRRGEPPTSDEVRAATEFFEAHSPNRMAYFNRLPADSQFRLIISNDLVWRYRPIRNFRDSSPELYDLLVRTVTLRDDAFKLAKDGDVEGLHAKAADIVATTLKSRKMRLDLLDEELKRQRDQFAGDSANPTTLIDAEVARLQDDEQRINRRAERYKNFRSELKADDATAETLTKSGDSPVSD